MLRVMAPLMRLASISGMHMTSLEAVLCNHVAGVFSIPYASLIPSSFPAFDEKSHHAMHQLTAQSCRPLSLHRKALTSSTLVSDPSPPFCW